MDKLDKLEAKQANLREAMTEEGFRDWLDLPYTKMLILQFEIDQEQLKESWKAYSPDEHTGAIAQSFYIDGLKFQIEDMMIK